jgi:hypothetical protein
MLEPMMRQSGANGAAGAVGVVAIFGGIPFVFGLACIFAGWVIRKGK